MWFRNDGNEGWRATTLGWAVNPNNGPSPEQQHALKALASCLPQETYLAGGVAVAIHARHRLSRDLDLFLPTEDPTQIVDRLTAEPGVTLTSRAEGTVYATVNGVPVSIIRYRYPLLARTTRTADAAIAIASIEDLVCMKLSAISHRGALRDFWDLHTMLSMKKMSLTAALELYQTKYASEDIGHVVRSLVYFADADAEPALTGLSNDTWTRIKSDARQWVAAL